ncbi:hypothetical protein GCM10027051_27400 [Niabella terrae]
MKRLPILSVVVVAIFAFTACKNNAGFEKTKSGLEYKIVEGPGDRKDTVKNGEVLRVQFTHRITGEGKDTLLQSTYETSPMVIPIEEVPDGQGDYTPVELFSKLRNGDSLVVRMLVDSMIMKGMISPAQFPPFIKRGDAFVYTFKVLGVYPNEAAANDASRKEEIAVLEKSGEKAKQDKEVQDYIDAKGLTTVKSPLGVSVKIDEPGTGAPAVDGKFLKVKYTGKILGTDSTFDSGELPLELGKGGSIPGFEDGLRQFKQGGKGTIFIPGYLAYGKDTMRGFKAYQPMYFNVEITEVLDSMPPQPQMPMAMPNGGQMPPQQ